MVILFVVLLLLVLYMVLNLFRLISTRRYYNKFLSKDPKLSEYVPAVDRLFDKAETNQVFAATRFEGKSITYCLGMNDYRTELDEIFRKTMGVYKFRIRNTFNPVYLLEIPDRIAKRFGLQPQTLPQIAFKFLFWAVTIAAAWLIEKSLDVLFPELPSILESILR